jgi:isocitrate lyase
MTTPIPTAPTTPAPDWSTPRWHGIQRDYTVADVLRLRGSVVVEHTLAKLGAAKLWHYLQTMPYVASLGALSGNQAMQMVRAGLKSIYLSGWQVAADNNTAGQMYPDQSLYPANSLPSWSKKSTAPWRAPTKSKPWRATATSIGSCRFWPMLRLALAPQRL